MLVNNMGSGKGACLLSGFFQEQQKMKEVLIIGAGASGLYTAALLGGAACRVTLADKNEKAGKKLFITGKGRCNLTNQCTEEEFLGEVMRNSRFLYSAIYAEPPEKTIERFRSWGLALKTERGRRVFPVSDRAGDVIDTLKNQIRKGGVRLLLNTGIKGLVLDGNGRTVLGAEICGEGEKILAADYVVLATGGRSYPSTGSTGDGIYMAKNAGLQITDTRPSLVPFTCREEYVRQLQGLSLKNVAFRVLRNGRELFREQGELMFTHFGITGPLVLSASARVTDFFPGEALLSEIDLKPALAEQLLDARIVRLIGDNPNKEAGTLFGDLYPRSLIPVMCALSGIDVHAKAHMITREKRGMLLASTKHFPLTITGTRGYSEAVITRGGIDVKEINPRTMEAKKIKNLFAVGELLDVDACTGGYNLQIAWSTASRCADAIRERCGASEN